MNSDASIAHLIRQLRDDAAQMVRDEVDLAKTEAKEIAARTARSLAIAALGGAVLLAGAMVLLFGLAHWLTGVFAQRMGEGAAALLGFSIIAVIVMGAGAAFLGRGLKALSGNRLTRSLARQVKAHPMPSLLIGGGLAWLIADGDDEPSFSSHSGTSHPGNAIADGLRDAKEAAGEAVDSAKEKITEAGHVVHDKAEQATHAIIEGSKTTVAKARTGLVDGYHASAEQFGKAVEEYPLGVGLAFAALGPLVGLALPHTRKEDELMGKQSEAVVEAVKEKGEELLETGKSVGARVIETVRKRPRNKVSPRTSLRTASPALPPREPMFLPRRKPKLRRH